MNRVPKFTSPARHHREFIGEGMRDSEIDPTWSRLGVSKPEMPVLISYYTNAFYGREAFELARTCQSFPLDYHISRVLWDKGGWVEGTNYKPTHLLKMSKRFPDRAICWVDADARVRRYPDLLGRIGAPIAYHTWPGLHGSRPGALSGTVLLGTGPQRDALLQEWMEEVRKNPNVTDQVCMERAVVKLGTRHKELPVEYVWIFDLAGETPNPTPNPEIVIEHMQASRWARRLRG